MKYLYLQAKSLLLFKILFWLFAFWYCNSIFTRYACSIVLPYEAYPKTKHIITLAQFCFGKNHKLYVVKFSKISSVLVKRFCFLWYFPLPFFITFPASRILSLGLWLLFFFFYCTGSHLTRRSNYDNSEQVFALLQTWLVFLFFQFLIWFRFCLLRWVLVLDVFMDARNIMPYWRNFQSQLILSVNFIQFWELSFVNKFTLSSKTLNK